MKKFLTAVAVLTLVSGTGISAAHADNNHRNNQHDWDKGRHWDHKDNRPQRAYYYYPRTYYAPPRTRVVYVQPQHTIYYSQTFASPSTTTTTYYPDGSYTQTYTVGGYLPDDRIWHPIPDYVRFGLAAPRRGERWVGNGRDALLITEATSRILSGVLLTTYIH